MVNYHILDSCARSSQWVIVYLSDNMAETNLWICLITICFIYTEFILKISNLCVDDGIIGLKFPSPLASDPILITHPPSSVNQSESLSETFQKFWNILLKIFLFCNKTHLNSTDFLKMSKIKCWMQTAISVKKATKSNPDSHRRISISFTLWMT